MLVQLDLRNNSMVLPNKFGRKEFPALIILYISGNNLQSFPQNFGTLNEEIVLFFMARCQINELPGTYLSRFRRLRHFDVRSNNISVVDASFQSLFYDDSRDNGNDGKRTLRAYFSGNPVCKTDILMRNTLSCDNMCSKFCWYKASKKSQAFGGCFPECNSEGCNYDQGRCLNSLRIRL